MEGWCGGGGGGWFYQRAQRPMGRIEGLQFAGGVPLHLILSLISFDSLLRAESPMRLNGFVNASNTARKPFCVTAVGMHNGRVKKQEAYATACNSMKWSSFNPGHVNLAKHVPRQIAKRGTKICFCPPFGLLFPRAVLPEGSPGGSPFRYSKSIEAKRHLRKKKIPCAKTAAWKGIV